MHGTCAGIGNSKDGNVKDIVFIALENRERITVNEVHLTFGYKDTIEKRRRKAPVNYWSSPSSFYFLQAKPLSIHE